MSRSSMLFRSTDAQTRLALACIGFVWLIITFGGGSSRADVLYLVPVRIAALAGIVVLLLFTTKERLHLQKGPLIFLAAAALLIALSLIPLPYSWWTALPGRSVYAGLSAAPEIGEIARPLSLTPDLTLNALFSLLPPLLFLLAVPAVDLRGQRWILSGLLITILLSGLLGLLQVAGGTESALRHYQFTNPDAATGFFANRNHQAVFLAMGIPLSFWWATRVGKGRRLRAAIAISCVLFLLTAAVTTQSRMGAITVVLALLLSAAAFYRNLQKRGRRIALAALALGAVLGAGAIATWSTGRLSLGAVSEDARIRNLPEIIEAGRTFFPVGAGFGSFPDVFLRFESTEDLSPQYMNHAHNDLAEIVVEGGLPALLFLAAFLIWLGLSWRSAWSRKADRLPGSDEARLCAILVVLPLTASLTDYPLRTPLMACAIAIAGAILGSFRYRRLRDGNRHEESRQG